MTKKVHLRPKVPNWDYNGRRAFLHMKAGTYIPYLMSVDGQGFFWGPICVFWVQDVSGLGGKVGVKWGK